MFRFIFIVLVISSLTQAKVVFADSKYYYDSRQCSKLHETPSSRLVEVEEIFQNLLEYSGLKGKFYLCPVAFTSKAFATNAFSLEGKVSIVGQFIGYDSGFINNLKKQTGYWGVTGVLAHELAHHILGHTHDGLGSQPKKELEADFIAGMLMELSGASLSNSMLLPSQPFLADGGLTHPDGKDRVIAFKKGWYKGCEKRPTPQCPNYRRKANRIIDNPYYKETNGYLKLLKLASYYKGRNVSKKYCHLYASVSVRQANRNKSFKCGYLIDAYEGSRWSLNRKRQFNWCLRMSAYATEKEAVFRENKLMQCKAK